MRWEDVPEMLRLSREMHEESVYRHLPFDESKVLDLVRACSDGKDYAGWVACDHGGLYGFFAGYITEYFFSRERMAKDIGLYVSPGRRGGLVGVRLVKAFLCWARACGVSEVALGVSALEDNSRTYQLYQRLGMEEMARVFKRRL